MHKLQLGATGLFGLARTDFFMPNIGHCVATRRYARSSGESVPRHKMQFGGDRKFRCVE